MLTCLCARTMPRGCCPSASAWSVQCSAGAAGRFEVSLLILAFAHFQSVYISLREEALEDIWGGNTWLGARSTLAFTLGEATLKTIWRLALVQDLRFDMRR
mmetsp:Transcript_2792/g.4809  ORF Transcript_2792/g.4809 Transcript_2792/m.4809 type:complete len:101 (+) Transcript_2792:61-363(+)